MKILLRAIITAASIASIAPAYAGDGDGAIADTRFTSIPGVSAQAPEGNVGAGTAHAIRAYVTQSSRGTWLFPPRDGGGANS
jgi:hypothetical protein